MISTDDNIIKVGFVGYNVENGDREIDLVEPGKQLGHKVVNEGVKSYVELECLRDLSDEAQKLMLTGRHVNHVTVGNDEVDDAFDIIKYEAKTSAEDVMIGEEDAQIFKARFYTDIKDSTDFDMDDL